MPMPSATSKVTRRNQTTIPPAVRKALHLEKGERLGYIIEDNEVRLVNASDLEEHADPIVTGFLDLLASDLKTHPERLRAFPPELLARAKELTKEVEIDHEAPIQGVDAL
ncbi:MAG: type II toxin-antitoxin system PrlF family antitoxin [Longimicrobiales bacterium]|nr:type II toxin-antitoxin system PrlF family antitoxin [Longimicrobiales bacterium]